ncbi:MAG: hypothetical protein V1755_05610 [Chloroflexota bacterium]
MPTLSFSLPASEADLEHRLDAEANRLGVSRSRLLVWYIHMGLEASQAHKDSPIPGRAPRVPELAPKPGSVAQALLALLREHDEVYWGEMIMFGPVSSVRRAVGRLVALGLAVKVRQGVWRAVATAAHPAA